MLVIVPQTISPQVLALRATAEILLAHLVNTWEQLTASSNLFL